MSESMVERIKNRNVRANVPQRDTSLIELTSKERAAQSQGNPDSASSSTTSNTTNPDLVGLTETAQRRQIRLKTNLDSEIDTYCKQHKITIETYLEALHLACQNNQELMDTVIVQAKKHLAERKQAGKVRRLHTQLKQDQS